MFDNACVQQTLELCKVGAASLEELLNDLAEKMDRKIGVRRRIGAARMVLQKAKIEKLKSRSKNAIQLLFLAYQCHTR